MKKYRCLIKPGHWQTSDAIDTYVMLDSEPQNGDIIEVAFVGEESQRYGVCRSFSGGRLHLELTPVQELGLIALDKQS